MAEEHIGPQFKGARESTRPARPLEGTAKHPEGRLLAPVGMHAGDPWKLAPENWMPKTTTTTHTAMDTAAPDDQGVMRRVPGATTSTTSTRPGVHGDITAWHSSTSSAVPRYDDPTMRQVDQYDHEGADWGNEEIDENGDYNEDYVDWSEDKKGRPMADYGSAVGMHLGDLKAAADRDKYRQFIHPLRIPSESLTAPPRGNFSTPRPGGSIAAGSMRSRNSVVNAETGERTEDTRWSDQAANFAGKATDLVESGKTLAYRNDIEAAGSTSYRTLPETTRTWSEDVLDAPNAHPALGHLAQQGYNPMVKRADMSTPATGYQQQLPGLAAPPSRQQSFEHGHAWRLHKAEDEDTF